MSEVSAYQLKTAVESLHECTAELSAVVEVYERFGGETIWHGTVHVLDVTGTLPPRLVMRGLLPSKEPSGASSMPVLGLPPVNSPSEAVRAATLSQRG